MIPTPALRFLTLSAILLAAYAGVPTPAAAQEPEPPAPQDTTEQRDRRGGLPLAPARSLEMTTSEGSWISLDVSPDGRTIVFDLLGSLYTVPVEGGQATRLTRGMGYDVQPRYSPDGQKVAFISDRSGAENLWILELETGDTTRVSNNTTTETFISPEWTPDGRYLVVSKGRGALDLWLYHEEGGSGVAMVTDPDGHKVGAAFGPDPRYVWFASRQRRHEYNADLPTYQIWAYDRESGNSTRMTNRWGSALRPTLSPDGRWLAYGTRHQGETGLRLRDIAAGDERWLAYPIQRDDQESVAPMDALPGFSFTPDSRAIIISYGGGIWRVPVDGGAAAAIPFTAELDVALGPEVRFDYEVEASATVLARQIRDGVPSPDGRRIAFTALNRLYVMDWPDGEPRRIAEMEAGQHHPSWSPDGRWIAFVTWTDDAGGHIWKVRSDGARPQRLTREPAYFRNTTWSPDGRRIVSIRGAVRDVQEARGSFGGGLATDFVWVSESGGAATRIALTEGRDRPHFTRDPDRIYASHRMRGLVSFRWDGTDERAHVVVRGRPAPGSQNPPRAVVTLMAPRGDQALAQVGMDLYVVTVPRIGAEPPEISVADPERAAFPARRLTDIGGQFPAWSADGRSVHWSIGNAHVRYDLDEARAADAAAAAPAPPAPDEPDEPEEPGNGDDPDEDDDAGDPPLGEPADAAAAPEPETPRYRPVERRIEVTAARDIPRGVAVLRGARAITMRGTEVIDDADIVVRDNRIEAVGRRGEVAVPDDAAVIDVTGRTIVPGYIDTHYHTQWLVTDVHTNQVWQYLANLAYGVTLTQDVQTSVTDILTYHDRVETGDMIGPRVYHTGPGVFLSENVSSLDHARDVLRRYRDYYRLNTFKMYMAGNRQQRQWLIMAARELELIPTTEGGIDFKLNMTHTIDGYPGLEHSLPISPLYNDVVQLYRTTGTTYSPTLLVAYGGPWAENYFYTRESPLDDPKMLHFTPYQDLESKASRRTRSAGWFHWNEHVFYKHAVFLKDLVEAGGRIGVGGHGQLHGLGWHWELWAMHAGGMTNHDALRAATILGAEAIGFGNDVGSIEPGKLADLVVLDANPLDEIRHTTAIRYVMKNGRLYEGDTLDEVWPRQRPLPSYHWQRTTPDGVGAGVRSGGGARPGVAARDPSRRRSLRRGVAGGSVMPSGDPRPCAPGAGA